MEAFLELVRDVWDFLKTRKISLSPSNINLIISKSNNDRENLLNELNKIVYYYNYYSHSNSYNCHNDIFYFKYYNSLRSYGVGVFFIEFP